MKNYKKIFFDIILNIIATVIPLIVLQLIILPLLSRRINEDEYGMILTIISIATIIATSLGNALNNIRLISQNVYKENGKTGDFQILLLGEFFVGIIITIIAIGKYNIDKTDYILVILMVLLWTAKEYYAVEFRINLDYTGIVISNVILVIGYMMGSCLYVIIGYWELIYVVGIFFSVGYIIIKSKIKFECLPISHLFRGTIVNLLILIAASLINNLLNYADRIIIYPLIGGTAVSIYYSSTLFGKLVSTAVSPINSVMLSYLSKKQLLQQTLILKVLLTSGFLGVIGYVVCRIIAYPALNILYPQWAEQSMEYVPITTLIAMVTMVTSTLTPFVLKFCAMKWQIVINASVLAVYLFSSVMLFKFYGLTGFCLGVLLSTIVKLIIMICVGMNASKEGKGKR